MCLQSQVPYFTSVDASRKTACSCCYWSSSNHFKFIFPTVSNLQLTGTRNLELRTRNSEPKPESDSSVSSRTATQNRRQGFAKVNQSSNSQIPQAPVSNAKWPGAECSSWRLGCQRGTRPGPGPDSDDQHVSKLQRTDSLFSA